MDENPGFIKRQLMKIDMGVFYWIMRTFKAGMVILDFFLDIFLGYTIQHGTREDRTKAEMYEYSAQLVHLLGRGAYSPLQPHQLNNFVWHHEKYVHPKYVIDHDNITLMSVTPTHVFFCVSDQTLDVLDTKVTNKLDYDQTNWIRAFYCILTDYAIPLHHPVPYGQKACNHEPLLI